jgi:hypothetical protein
MAAGAIKAASGRLIAAVLQTRDALLMSMSDTRQAVDALQHVRHEDLVFFQSLIVFPKSFFMLPESFFMLPETFLVHVNQQFQALRKDFVAFGKPLQSLVNGHLLPVYPMERAQSLLPRVSA